jgi:hypothetical protein
MKLTLIAPLLLSLVAVPAFAHGNHDDDEPAKPTTEAAQDAAAKPKADAPAAPKKEAPTPAPAEPKKP